MITGDQLAIAKETGRHLGMGTNMYPFSLLGGHKDESIDALPIDELIEKADGLPESSVSTHEIVKKLQDMKHICGITGDSVNDAPALKKANIGIAVQQFGFLFIALIWKFDFSLFMVLIIAILNDDL